MQLCDEVAVLELIRWILFKSRQAQGVIFKSGSTAAVCKAVKSLYGQIGLLLSGPVFYMHIGLAQDCFKF